MQAVIFLRSNWLLVALWILGILIVAIDSASSAPGCLSKQQARAVWPTAYISWRRIGGKQCWSAPGKKQRTVHVEIVKWGEKNRLDYAADKRVRTSRGGRQ